MKINYQIINPEDLGIEITNPIADWRKNQIKNALREVLMEQEFRAKVEPLRVDVDIAPQKQSATMVPQKTIQVELPRTWTRQEVAEKLGKSTKAIQRLEICGKFKRIPNVSRPVLYTDDSVRRFLSGAN